MNLIHCQFDSSLTVDILDIDLQGSRSDWKTWKNGQGKVREFLTDWKSHRKAHKILGKIGGFQIYVILSKRKSENHI